MRYGCVEISQFLSQMADLELDFYADFHVIELDSFKTLNFVVSSGSGTLTICKLDEVITDHSAIGLPRHAGWDSSSTLLCACVTVSSRRLALAELSQASASGARLSLSLRYRTV